MPAVFGLRVLSLLQYLTITPVGQRDALLVGGRRSPCRPGRGGAAGPARRRHAAPPHADTGRLHRVISTDLV